VAIVVWTICGALFARTFWFDQVPSSLAQNVQPPAFPRLVLLTIALIALIIPFEHFRKIRSGIDLDEERAQKLSPIVPITAVILLALVATMPILGALPALVLVALVLPILWGERRWKVLIPYVLIFPLAVLFLFAEVLQVTFPRGLTGGVFN
jgi:putative tricarboxylic transport membrane protein